MPPFQFSLLCTADELRYILNKSSNAYLPGSGTIQCSSDPNTFTFCHIGDFGINTNSSFHNFILLLNNHFNFHISTIYFISLYNFTLTHLYFYCTISALLRIFFCFVLALLKQPTLRYLYSVQASRVNSVCTQSTWNARAEHKRSNDISDKSRLIISSGGVKL